MTQLFKGKGMSYRLPYGEQPVEGVRMYVYSYGEGGRIALQLTVPSEELGESYQEPFLTCTVHLPDSPCAGNEVYVKDWSENEGMAEWLIAQGVIEPKPVGHANSDWVTAARYRLTAGAMMEIAAALTRGRERRLRI